VKIPRTIQRVTKLRFFYLRYEGDFDPFNRTPLHSVDGDQVIDDCARRSLRTSYFLFFAFVVYAASSSLITLRRSSSAWPSFALMYARNASFIMVW
jgi:hypothetical protein